MLRVSWMFLFTSSDSPCEPLFPTTTSCNNISSTHPPLFLPCYDSPAFLSMKENRCVTEETGSAHAIAGTAIHLSQVELKCVERRWGHDQRFRGSLHNGVSFDTFFCLFSAPFAGNQVFVSLPFVFLSSSCLSWYYVILIKYFEGLHVSLMVVVFISG